MIWVFNFHVRGRAWDCQRSVGMSAASVLHITVEGEEHRCESRCWDAVVPLGQGEMPCHGVGIHRLSGVWCTRGLYSSESPGLRETMAVPLCHGDETSVPRLYSSPKGLFL